MEGYTTTHGTVAQVRAKHVLRCLAKQFATPYSLDDDLADHAVIGVGLAVAAGNAAAQIGDLAGRHRHEPPFRRLPRINLDLADRALELGEVDGLAVAQLRDLDLAGEDHLAEGMRGEVVRIVARVFQHQFVELAGLEAQFVGHEGMLARLAKFDRDHDGFLAGQIAGGLSGGRGSEKYQQDG